MIEIVMHMMGELENQLIGIQGKFEKCVGNTELRDGAGKAKASPISQRSSSEKFIGAILSVSHKAGDPMLTQ